MPTDKLYWQDPFAVAFEATAARPSTFEGKPSLVLDKTLFYPEAGGQLADTGLLNIGTAALRVEDVQIDESEEIHHLVPELATVEFSQERIAGGAAPTVTGTIDRERRRDHMTQHTAQHMLSRALLDVARAETVSARLGASSCTIDVSLSDVPERDLARAEDLVNEVAMSDVVVRALFPTAGELAT